MIRAWRIVKGRHADPAFDGEGARVHGGRWTSPGRPAVYVSESRALATLEILAGLGSTSVIPAYVLIGVDLDESLVVPVDRSALTDGWDASPPTAASRSVGDSWLAKGTSAVLEVPSAIIPQERNYLLNPAHPDFRRIRTGAPEFFRMTSRVAGG